MINLLPLCSKPLALSVEDKRQKEKDKRIHQE